MSMRKRLTLAAAAVMTVIAAAVTLMAVTAGAAKPSVRTCTAQIVAHPVHGPWPMCKGLTATQLAQATANAMAQGATG